MCPASTPASESGRSASWSETSASMEREIVLISAMARATRAFST